MSRIYLLITFICFIGCNNSVPISDKTIKPTGSLFIIGGGDRPKYMIERMVAKAGLRDGGGGYIFILPLASAEPDSAVFYAKKQFSEVGVENVFSIMEVNEEFRNSLIDSLSNSTLIYITGGDQSRFMEAVKNTLIEAAIKKAYEQGGMIAGTSAGAAVLSKKMITGRELKYTEYEATFRSIEADNLELKEGLGLLPNVILDQHFVARSRYNRLITAVIEYPEIIGIGIDEATALFVKNGMAEVVGESQVLVFSNPEKSKRLQKGKLGANGLVLDVYLPGEKFVME